MSVALSDLFKSLKEIRTYLIKIGPERRKKDIGESKLREANLAYSQLDNILCSVKTAIDNSEVSTDDTVELNRLVCSIHKTYSEIIKLVTIDTCKDILKMAEEKISFDLKTAISLLPIMNGQENITKQLIDGIELYNSMLNNASKPLLINFVLKSRLSSSAKLRLKQSYSNIDLLLSDMRRHLLQKKSAVAIQSRLQNSKQGHRSIEAFGNELEDLFVNLTLEQANGDSTNFDILRPLNEKMAIKRFADGLNNPRLSTIIAARQFDSLSEAIRSAIDEQTLSSNAGEHVNNFNHSRSRPFVRNNYGFRGSIGRTYNYHNRNERNSNSIQSDSGFATRGRRGHISTRGAPHVARAATSSTRGRGSMRGYAPRVQHTQCDAIEAEASHETLSNANKSMFFRSE
jgi:hypothetical protein